jgi:hypothetical protein
VSETDQSRPVYLYPQILNSLISSTFFSIHYSLTIHSTVYNLCVVNKQQINKYINRYVYIISPTEAEDFSSNLCVQTGSGAHRASCTMGTGGSFPGGKERPGRDADHSPPSSAEVKKGWEIYLISPQAPPWRVPGQLYVYIIDNTQISANKN